VFLLLLLVQVVQGTWEIIQGRRALHSPGGYGGTPYMTPYMNATGSMRVRCTTKGVPPSSLTVSQNVEVHASG
jgi:hypothetical protein